MSVYVLKLKGGNYYVGSTKRNVYDRIKEHIGKNIENLGKGSKNIVKELENEVQESRAAAWTKKYSVEDLIGFTDGTEKDEDNITIQLMKIFGKAHVRGGQWVKVSPDPDVDLNQHFPYENKEGCCFICNNPGHYCKDCKISKEEAKKLLCYRCFCIGHETKKCKRVLDVFGRSISLYLAVF